MKQFVVRAIEAAGRDRSLRTEAWWMLGIGLIFSADGPFWIKFPLFMAGYIILSFQRK